MKWVGRLMTSAAAVLLTAGGVSTSSGKAPAQADVAWAEAMKDGTLEAYAQFAIAYPESEHVQEAYGKLSAAARPSEPAAADDESESNSQGILTWIPRMTIV